MGGHQKGKLEVEGKIWEQLQWKAMLVRWEQPEGLSPNHAGEVWDNAGTTGLLLERGWG